MGRADAEGPSEEGAPLAVPRPPAIDIAGRTFGRLTVIQRASGPVKHGQQVRWTCRCSCGREHVVGGYHLRSGRTISCGCASVEALVARSLKHGERSSAEYRTWCHILRRCLVQAAKDYPRYGGRGITVCRRWREDFSAFLADVGRRPSARHSLDRIKNERGYEPGNVRWATAREQANNRRDNRTLTHRGRTMTIAAWAREAGLNRGTLRSRIDSGWSIDAALTTPRDARKAPR